MNSWMPCAGGAVPDDETADDDESDSQLSDDDESSINTLTYGG